MDRWLFRQLPDDVAATAGLRYYTLVWLLKDRGLVEHVFLAGPVPYTVDVVTAELIDRGYDVRRVWVPDGRYATGNFQAEVDRFHFHERYRVLLDRSGPAVWVGVTMDDVVHRTARGCWVKVFPRQSDDDDDWMPSISRNLAEAITRALGIRLPPHERLTEIAAQARARLQRHWKRDEAWYQRRRRQFQTQAAEVAALAVRRAQLPPAPVVDDDDTTRRAAEDALQALPVRFDEPFPLIRALIGRPGHAQLTVNRISLDTPDGPVRATIKVWPRQSTLEYPTVTPFCPPEGYQPDDSDTDAASRAEKLRDDLWGHVAPAAFPVSPCRLRVDLSAGYPARLLTDVWLELTFGPGARFLGVPDHEPGVVVYQEFVPASRPPLAEVPGWAPAWLSINVPPAVELLKTVTATLRHLPGRHRPSPDDVE